MGETFFVNLTLEDCEQVIGRAVADSVTGECVDRYEQPHPAAGRYVVLVYEKYYYRAGNRLTLTVALDDFTGRTRVHCAGGGGGDGIFRFDWGAAESFEQVVHGALRDYRA